MAKKSAPKADMKERVTSLAAMGYLAAIFISQDENEQALDVIEKMAACLQADPDVARALDPFLEATCKAMGFDLVTVPIEEVKSDRGLH